MTAVVFDDFDSAQAAAADTDMVCAAVLPDGTPKYFVVPKDSPDDDIRDRSFEIREGRPPSTYERWLLQQAIERKQVSNV